MNKKSILLILLSTLALGANAQGKYTINGNLLNADGQKNISVFWRHGEHGYRQHHHRYGKFT